MYLVRSQDREDKTLVRQWARKVSQSRRRHNRSNSRSAENDWFERHRARRPWVAG